MARAAAALRRSTSGKRRRAGRAPPGRWSTRLTSEPDRATHHAGVGQPASLQLLRQLPRRTAPRAERGSRPRPRLRWEPGSSPPATTLGELRRTTSSRSQHRDGTGVGVVEHDGGVRVAARPIDDRTSVGRSVAEIDPRDGFAVKLLQDLAGETALADARGTEPATARPSTSAVHTRRSSALRSTKSPSGHGWPGKRRDRRRWVAQPCQIVGEHRGLEVGHAALGRVWTPGTRRSRISHAPPGRWRATSAVRPARYRARRSCPRRRSRRGSTSVASSAATSARSTWPREQGLPRPVPARVSGTRSRGDARRDGRSRCRRPRRTVTHARG